MDVLQRQSQVGRSDRARAVRRQSVLVAPGVLQQLDGEPVRRFDDCRPHIRIVHTCNLMQEVASHFRLPFEREPQRFRPEPDRLVQRGNGETRVIHGGYVCGIGHC